MSKRYVIIDYQHLAYRCMVMPELSTTVNINGQMQVVTTTIPSGTIKNIFSYSGRGAFYTAVCFEGSNQWRRDYFSKQPGAKPSVTKGSAGYKSGRQRQGGMFYEGIDLSIRLLHRGQVSLYRSADHEADDCIAALVAKIKSVDDLTPIDIITGDSDMLPLVDDQVSVYMRGSRTFAEEGCPERHLYYQVTPDTWDDYLANTSAYKGYLIPYNSMLLFKMIRGDKTDEVNGATKGYGAVKYSQLMEEMIMDRVEFDRIFRYDVDFDTTIRPTLINYFDEDTVAHMKFIFEGIKPRLLNLEVPKQIDVGILQAALQPVKINLIR